MYALYSRVIICYTLLPPPYPPSNLYYRELRRGLNINLRLTGIRKNRRQIMILAGYLHLD
jgi:hypothetical protein